MGRTLWLQLTVYFTPNNILLAKERVFYRI